MAIYVTLSVIVLVSAAIGAVAYLRLRGRKPADAAAPASGPLLAAEERRRDSVLPAGGTRREIALRSAFAPSATGVHVAPWGCVTEGGVVALVSPTGRDDPRRGVVQTACATQLAAVLPRSERSAGAIMEAFQSADQSVARLGIPTSTAAATAVAIALDDYRVRTAHVGADRVYRLRGGQVEQLTHDHSIADDALRQKGLDRESSPDLYDDMPAHLKTAFTRVLGTGKERVEVAEHDLSPDAWLVMVSHDVALALGEVNLRRVLSAPPASPGALADELVVQAYRQRPGAFAAAAVLGPARA